MQDLAQDTIRLIDTVQVVDTLRIGEGFFSTGAAAWGVVWSVVWGFVVLLFGSDILQKRSARRAAKRSILTKVSTEARDARRMLRAGFEHQTTEPPPNSRDLLIKWAKHAGEGFNEIERRFTKLKELAADAPENTKKVILDSSAEFDEASGIINRALGGKNITAGEEEFRDAYRVLRGVIGTLKGSIEEDQRDRDDGYNEP